MSVNLAKIYVHVFRLRIKGKVIIVIDVYDGRPAITQNGISQHILSLFTCSVSSSPLWNAVKITSYHIKENNSYQNTGSDAASLVISNLAGE